MSQQQASVSVSALRRRMLDDMAMRGLREETQRNYIMFVRGFAAFLGRSPDTATADDVRRFQVHQAESGVQPPTVNCSVSALRFLFTVTLDRPDLSRRLVLVRHEQTGNLRAVQILLGHTKIESTVRYLGVDVEDALTLAERTEI